MAKRPSLASAASVTTRASSSAFGFGPIDGQIPFLKRGAAQGFPGFRGGLFCNHFHKRKAARTTRVTVRHKIHILHFSVSREKRPNVICGRLKVQIPDIEFVWHVSPQ
jgi:hypothetical protein